MSGVVLRCPNCGTIQQAPGECDTCRQAQVRYFCSNHSPGNWLQGPACGACGARFGGVAGSASDPRRRSPAGASAAPEARSSVKERGSADSRVRQDTARETSTEAENEAALDILQRRLETQQILLRALLTHLAMSDPESFGAILGGLLRSGHVPDDVAREFTSFVEEVAASLD